MFCGHRGKRYEVRSTKILIFCISLVPTSYVLIRFLIFNSTPLNKKLLLNLIIDTKLFSGL